MTTLQATLLGIVQGLTEFLPISSSAHLILARAGLGWDAGELGLPFDVACHVGTLVAVLAYFRQDVVAMVIAAPTAFRPQPDETGRLVRHVIIATIPAVVAGLLFADVIRTTLRTPVIAAVALAAGAVVMLVAERVGSRIRTESTLTTLEALGLGGAQALALVPGVSRSGAVLTLGILFGLRRERAARFAFLLGIPAILGAAGLEAADLMSEGWPEGATGLFVAGLVVSALVGYVTVKYFIRYLVDHSLGVFAGYRLVLAAVIMTLTLARP